MNLPKQLKSAFSQPATLDTLDSGLQFTDILFGFVITKLFVRLQDWGTLQGYIRWQLIASTVLVLGSWIGFRNSLNRSRFQVKFFNLPLARFILDQLMVLLYFRIAILTPSDLAPSDLANSTAETLLIIFVLYFLWDAIGLLMSIGRHGNVSKYQSTTDWPGIAITFLFLICFGVLYCVVQGVEVCEAQAKLFFIIATALILAYRFAKDVRSALKPKSPG